MTPDQRKDVAEKFVKNFTKPLHDMLDDVLDYLPTIAQHTHKKNPPMSLVLWAGKMVVKHPMIRIVKGLSTIMDAQGDPGVQDILDELQDIRDGATAP